MNEVSTFARVDRVAEQVRREVGDILKRKTKDPRLAKCVVSRVRMSNDLRVAWVFLSVYPEDLRAEVTDALTSATGYIRRELSTRLDLRRCPELRFDFDDGAKRLIEMSALIHSLDTDEDDTDEE